MTDGIRVVIAEDSPTVRHYLCSIIDNTLDMSVVGEARNGNEAVRMVDDLRPDVVSMDINMPDLDGLDATRIIMEQTPTPIVVVSGLLDIDVHLSLKAIEAGALAVVGKPPNRDHPNFRTKRDHLLRTLRAMASVKVISRRKLRNSPDLEVQRARLSRSDTKIPRPELIVIGASTGGPSALLYFLKKMPTTMLIPMVIVQHMPNEFINGLAAWLNSVTAMPVLLAEDNMLLESGTVLLARGDTNLSIIRHNHRLMTQFVPDSEQSRYVPSVDVLFESVARTVGKGAVGIIMTGMGDDGAKGLLAIRQAGGYTLVQDEASSTVFGMPNAAIQIGAAHKILPLADLPSKIKKML